MTILCTTTAPSSAALVSAIGADVSLAAELPAVEESLRHRPYERLVVIGPDVDLALATEFAANQRLLRPTISVLLVRHELDLDVLAQAMRAGIREVVAASDLPGIADACRRCRALSEATERTATVPGPAEGKIVTVFATKGGCGKTTVATNLAVSLHDDGAGRVCLVDLDLACGDVAISLRLDPKRTLTDAVAMGENLDATGVARLLTPFRPGLDCVLAPVEPGDAEKVPAEVIERLLTVLRGMFDYVVVDTPPQFNEHVLKALDCADHHVLLTNPDLASLKNLRLSIDMLDLLSYPRELRSIVLNREDSRVGITAADVERVIRTEVAVRIPASLDVPASMNRGEPLASAQPQHKVSMAIRELATRHVPGRVPAAERSGRRRFRTLARRSKA